MLLYVWQMYTKLLQRKQTQFIFIVAKLYLACRRKYKTKSQVPNGRECGEPVYVVPKWQERSFNECDVNVLLIFIFLRYFWPWRGLEATVLLRREENQPQALPPSWRASVSLCVWNPTCVLSGIMSELEHLNWNGRWGIIAQRGADSSHFEMEYLFHETQSTERLIDSGN
jgi:hypothetical protein